MLTSHEKDLPDSNETLSDCDHFSLQKVVEGFIIYKTVVPELHLECYNSLDADLSAVTLVAQHPMVEQSPLPGELAG